MPRFSCKTPWKVRSSPQGLCLHRYLGRTPLLIHLSLITHCLYQHTLNIHSMWSLNYEAVIDDCYFGVLIMFLFFVLQCCPHIAVWQLTDYCLYVTTVFASCFQPVCLWHFLIKLSTALASLHHLISNKYRIIIRTVLLCLIIEHLHTLYMLYNRKEIPPSFIECN